MKANVKVIKPSGILDGTQANKFRQEITESLAKNTKIILIDFQDVTFMDSSGLGVLVLALKNARTAGCELFLCSINEQIKMLFELTSMDQVFKIYGSREEFELTMSN
jgi:anti-anti-sigma factor